ncbi:MAG: nucleoside kinase [Lachnospiraceae bacterium]|nr:nucleoside kinase [Lachnospiraceae bacterium]
MSYNVKLKVDGQEVIYSSDCTYHDIAKDFQNSYEHDIILAKQGAKLIELTKYIDADADIKFVTTETSSGHRTYVRGMIILMLKCFYDNYGDDIKNIYVRYSLGDSLYCEVDGMEVTDEIIKDVEKSMRKVVSLDLSFEKRSFPLDKAMKIFDNHKMYDKKRLFNYRRTSKVNIYNLAGFEDYFYGYMPPTTGVLKYFALQKYEKGFLINMPGKKAPEVVQNYKEQRKLFETLCESTRWGSLMGVQSVGSLNDVIAEEKINELILVQEALQEKKIAEIASEIKSRENVKFVMIAGPSSSGKTSFSHRLEIQLKAIGLHAHTISVDNYFKERKDTPKDENGNYDFECLEAIDIEKFNKDMQALLRGEKVELPEFDFIEGTKRYNGDFMQLSKNDVLVIEGIHCLNDKLSHSLPSESKFKIYISALIQLNVDEHNRISTTDGRLIRRMVRDNMTRGIDARSTINRWPSVRRGEDHYIFPFQEEADVMFNSALIYEMAVLKPYADNLLLNIPKNCKEYEEANRLLKFLDYFLVASSDFIPQNSILREFIGGSVFFM